MNFTGSVTTTLISPKIRGVTCSCVSGSIMSPMGPPKGMLRTGVVFTKKISLMKTCPPVKLFTICSGTGCSASAACDGPGGSTPMTRRP
jgi:hypothetical protein